MVYHLATPVTQPALPVEGKVPLTEVRKTKGTIKTSATGSQETHNNAISRLRQTHIVAQFFDHPGGFVTDNNRHITGPFSPESVKVTVADGRGGDPNFHFALLRWVKLQLFNR
jgi:hypothetical protein